MFRRLTTAALAITIAASSSEAAVSSSEFALPIADPGSTRTAIAPALGVIVEPVPVTFAGVVYQPRPHPVSHEAAPVTSDASQDPRSQVQIHGGFFRPDGGLSDGFVAGMRGGAMLSPNAELGLSADWQYRSSEQSQAVSAATGPGGTPITTSRQISSFSESTFPLLAFLQLSVDPDRFIAPYAGIGGGYEFVTLTATDFVTASTFNATYGDWGWQAWLGARIKVARQAGVFAEAYRNQCTAKRDVYDPVGNQTLRESVNLDGVGMRFGLSFVM